MPTVLAILAEGFEEIEAITPIDLLRRAGARVTVAALGTAPDVTGRSGVTVRADTKLDALPGFVPGGTPPLFDCLLLPGGPGVRLLRTDERVRALVRAHAAADRWLAAICAAPTVLNDAALLDGRRYTAHPSVAGELTAILATERVVVADRIITSRGAGTSLDFGLCLIENLISPEVATEIARSVCA